VFRNRQSGEVVSYPSQILFVLSFGKFAVSIGVVILSPLLPMVIVDLGISRAQAGLALTFLSTTSALAQYPSGQFSDRIGRKVVLVTGLACTIVASVLFGFIVESYSMLLVSATLFGLGAGLYSTTGYAQLTDLFSKGRGLSFGLYTAAQDIGSGAAAGVAIVAVTVATWQFAFVPLVVLLLGAVATLHFIHRDSYRFDVVRLHPVRTGRRLLSSRTVRWTLTAYTLQIFVWMGTMSFLPTFLGSEKGVSTVFAGGAFSLLFLIGIFARPIGGSLGDTIGRRVVSVSALLLGNVGLLVLTLSEDRILIVVGVILFAGGLLAYAPPILAYLMGQFPDGTQGGDLGGFRTMYLAIGSTAPTYMGFVADTISFTHAYLSLSVLLGFALFITLKLIDD